MKFLSIASLLMLCCLSSVNAQSVTAAQFPKSIVTSVLEKFPDNEDIDWRMKDNMYEVEIDGPDKNNTWMKFDQSGKLIMQKEYISPAYLPGGISQTISEQYAGFNATNTEKLMAAGKTYYQVELKNRNGKKQNLVFSEAGQITMEIPFWN